MVPLRLLKDDAIHELTTEAFHQSIIDVCNKHREESRALAFAFILYDFENPQINKILNDLKLISLFSLTSDFVTNFDLIRLPNNFNPSKSRFPKFIDFTSIKHPQG